MVSAISFVENIISSGEPWTDEKFPPNQTSLFNDDDEKKDDMKKYSTNCNWSRS